MISNDSKKPLHKKGGLFFDWIDGAGKTTQTKLLRKKGGLFVSFEGIDGAGKTTQSKMLCNTLTRIGHEGNILTKEPSDKNFAIYPHSSNPDDINNRSVSQIVRHVIEKKENVDPVTELMLIYAARREHVQNLILPSLRQGIHVICDRFYESSVAYLARETGLHTAKSIVKALHEKTIPEQIMPDITILLDVNENEASSRIKKRSKQLGLLGFSKYDYMSTETLSGIRQTFKLLQDNQKGRQRIFLIDGNDGDIEKIHLSVMDIIKPMLSQSALAMIAK